MPLGINKESWGKRHQRSSQSPPNWRKIFSVKTVELYEKGWLLLFRQKLNFWWWCVRERIHRKKNGVCHHPRDKNRIGNIQWPYVRGFIIYKSLETRCKIVPGLHSPLWLEAKGMSFLFPHVQAVLRKVNVSVRNLVELHDHMFHLSMRNNKSCCKYIRISKCWPPINHLSKQYA